MNYVVKFLGIAAAAVLSVLAVQFTLRFFYDRRRFVTTRRDWHGHS